MKRFVRRAAVVSVLLPAGFAASAPSANAGDLCAVVTVWVAGSGVPVGNCVSGIGLGTICVDTSDITIAGTGAGALVCVPV